MYIQPFFQTLGFFSFNPEKRTSISFADNYDQLVDFARRDRIVDISVVTDKRVQLTLSSAKEDPLTTFVSEPKSRKSCCTIGKSRITQSWSCHISTHLFHPHRCLHNFNEPCIDAQGDDENSWPKRARA